MGNSSRPGSIVTGTRRVRVVRVDGEYYRVLESTWNGTDGLSYDVERISDDVVLTESESFGDLPADADVRDLVDALTAGGQLPPPPALRPVPPPAPGAPLAVTPGWDAVVWRTGDTSTTAAVDADTVVGWTATTQSGQVDQDFRILDDGHRTRLVSPYPTAAPGQPSGRRYCAECATPDRRARDVRGAGPWHQEPCSRHIPVPEWLPQPGTPIALLPHARCVLWLVNGKRFFAPVTNTRLVDWSHADAPDPSTWFHNDAEYEEVNTATTALYRHQAAGDLVGLAHALTLEADMNLGDAAAEVRRDTVRLLYVQAERERRAAVEQDRLWGTVPRLEMVVDKLADYRAQTEEPARLRALQDVAGRLTSFTQGENYRVTLLVSGLDYREVVVRATNRAEATQRAKDVRTHYFVGGCPPLDGSCEVVFVVRLTLVPGLPA
ncbi:hypothetical protein ALI22I_20345 [Saccharothrix sp. ALI-22-I]|uniref:hypothetical protein n=1 Tax=Saccharothrix sp. ALI-22-I TaxID=1933778 RepID=UPI00097BFC06|nr:hypothetical protein [Saccharothrix sp. ALI-22-I]ONI88091.1 hypothetical protein ALI22I_20345 [Saccharothrix sp. ALI-22-I]